MPSHEIFVLAIDTERCIGGGQCELMEPEMFEVDADTGIATVIGDGKMAQLRAEGLMDRCPGQAIIRVDADDGADD
ncbi:MAG: ferredoxin [Actinomycetota bacterium]